MAVGKAKAKTVGSLKDLKRELKDSGGGSNWFYRLAADSEITVRFLVEPTEFTWFWQHYDGSWPEKKRGFPCNTGDCFGCDEGNKARKVWVAPVVEVANKQVRVMVIPKTIVESLVDRFERWSTIMDRDYIIMREGSTMENTSYELVHEAPRKMKLSGYAMPDIAQMIEDQIKAANSDDDDDDDTDEEPPWATRKGAKKVTKKVVKKATKTVAKKAVKKTLNRAAAEAAKKKATVTKVRKNLR